ncbi:unnamed protein product [Spirodela intermedia]|uniref:Uncharacterized protein n=1 Tax=Spirodela intermedia TaxID=51605 RepID=A0A7I8J5F5_SPIIN|nr:unnamed protein product [Spirodela intermedia]CAA6664995.1 unnamed protein product [Spirodela intermedia]
MEPSVVPCDPYPPGMLLRETKQEVPSLEYDVKDNQPDAGGTLTSNMVGRISGSEHVMQPQSGERNSFISITPVISRATKVKPPPTWLPDDWYYEDIERKSGRSIGKIDRVCYVFAVLLPEGIESKIQVNVRSAIIHQTSKEQTECEMRKIKSTTSTNKGTCFPSIIQEIDATSCQTCKGMLIFPQGQTFYHIPIPKTGVMKHQPIYKPNFFYF